tara:strand:- start:226 stop:990 length:765 start_codon:yes stop_codon:yes gene_type:complete
MNRFLRTYLMIALISLPAASAMASETETTQTFISANADFKSGNYESALAKYNTLLEQQPNNGHLYYNQGNTYLRLGLLGAAIAAYRQGLVFLPRSTDLKANLNYARSLTKDDLEPVSAHPLIETIFFWHRSLNRHELLFCLAIINLIFWLSLATHLYIKRHTYLRWLNIASLTLFLALGSSWLVHTFAPTTVALVNEDEIEVYAANRVDSVVRFKLHAGSEVEVVSEQKDWLRIRLNKTQEGWLEKTKVALVQL